VNDVVTFAESDVVAPPTFGTRVRYEHLVGLGRRAGKFVVLLDAEKLLAIDELLAVMHGRDSLAVPAARVEEGPA
jgi:purine-binding chemotaxis protein CheW